MDRWEVWISYGTEWFLDDVFDNKVAAYGHARDLGKWYKLVKVYHREVAQ